MNWYIHHLNILFESILYFNLNWSRLHFDSESVRNMLWEKLCYLHSDSWGTFSHLLIDLSRSSNVLVAFIDTLKIFVNIFKYEINHSKHLTIWSSNMVIENFP